MGRELDVISFFSIGICFPPVVLVIGLATFLGFWGTGTILLICVRRRFPSPWNHVTATLLGILAASLLVQIAGMIQAASQAVLITIWLTTLVFGFAALIICLRSRAITIFFSECWKRAALPLAILGIAIAINLLVAMAPSTKIDELYYHMLVPSRIVSEEAIRFYLEPWQAAIWPQMIFQISAALVDSLGYPDATNIVSWAIGVMLVWFSWCVIRASSKSLAWTAIWVGCLCVGMYSVVWQVTAGAHAMGDLAMAAAIVGLCKYESLLKACGPVGYASMLSILSLSAAATKISLLPLSFLILCIALLQSFPTADSATRRRVVVAGVSPWLIFLLPIATWTWVQSGSPFGPVLADVMGHSIYRADWVEATFRMTRDVGQGDVSGSFEQTALNYSPILWLGVVGLLVGTDLRRSMRIVLSGLFVLQSAIIFWLLPYEARYLGGLHFGLLIIFACYATHNVQEKLQSTRAIIAICTIFLLPWLCLQAYYGIQFFPVALGQEKSSFYQRYIAFYVDYLALDKLLPEDGVILVSDFRLDSVYMPRPVFFDAADLPRRKPVVWFASPQTIFAAGKEFAGYAVGDVIYENSQAITEAYRTPGRRPLIGALKVVRLGDRK